MMVIPGSTCVAQQVYEAFAQGNASGGSIDDLRKVGGLADPVPQVGPTGSAAFYSSYTIHAAQFPNKRVRALDGLFRCVGGTTQDGLVLPIHLSTASAST